VSWTTLIRRRTSWLNLEAEQKRRVAVVQANPSERFLLVSEPRPTFTYGRSATPADLLWGPEQCKTQSVDVQPVGRGGRWTYHGPGQILLYPIVQLQRLGYSRRAVHRFLVDLRQGVGNFLTSVGLSPELRDRPFGIYVGGRKLVSFGICLQRGVSSHGLALYLTTQQSFFRGIHPCGVPNEAFTSLEECGIALSWEKAAEQLEEEVKKNFKNEEKPIV
jgi:lipoate-protein ligase B